MCFVISDEGFPKRGMVISMLLLFFGGLTTGRTRRII